MTRIVALNKKNEMNLKIQEEGNYTIWQTQSY